MDNLDKLLGRYDVVDIKYVYPENIQAELDSIDNAVADIALSYSQMYADSYHPLTQYDAMMFNELYQTAVSPLLAKKADLIARTVPSIILNVTEKPTLY